MSYRFLPHTADVLIEIQAPTFDDLLADCVAVVRELVAGPSVVTARETRPIAVTGDQPRDVVLHFVHDLLDTFATDAFIPAAFDATRSSVREASGVVRGELFDAARHDPQPEVKALTRHGLEVTETKEGWHALLLFDV